MSLSETVLKKLSKDEVIALALDYQKNFDSTLTNINKEISADKSTQNCLVGMIVLK